MLIHTLLCLCGFFEMVCLLVLAGHNILRPSIIINDSRKSKSKKPISLTTTSQSNNTNTYTDVFGKVSVASRYE